MLDGTVIVLEVALDNADRLRVLGIIDQFRTLGIIEDIPLPQVS
jgi:hypothetical protein